MAQQNSRTDGERQGEGRPGPSLGGEARPLRILIVAPSLDILGGQAVQAGRLFARLGEDSSLQLGFQPINPRLPGLLRKLQAIKYVRTVVTSILYCGLLLARVYKYDVIHIFSASYFSFVLAPTPAILIAKLCGRKTLLNYHSGEAEDHLTRWRRSAIRTIRLVDEVAVPSDYLVRVFARFGLHARAIFNIIEPEEFRFLLRQPIRPVFLSNRNLEPLYGVDRVLRAFAIIQRRFPDARLTVAGNGSERRALEQLASELSLRNTEFIGQVRQERAAELYGASDIFLNGSQIDNQPLSILEAFASGLPVVTTDAGGIPDMVTNGETGFVVTRGDYQAMADCAMRLLENQELACKVAQQARAECRKYSWEAVRQQWLDLYRGLARIRASASEAGTEIDSGRDAIHSEREIAGRS